jgi:hypothetical protein
MAEPSHHARILASRFCPAVSLLAIMQIVEEASNIRLV